MKLAIVQTIVGTLLVPVSLFSQTIISLDEAIALAREKNPVTQAATLGVQQQEALRGTIVDLPQTEVSFLLGQYNSINRNDNNVTVSQTIPFPTVFTSAKQLVNSRIAQAKEEAALTDAGLVAKVRRKFNDVLFFKERNKLLLLQDSVFRELVRVARVRYETGEGTRIELTAAESQQMQAVNVLERNRIDIAATIQQLAMLCVTDNISDVSGTLKDIFPFALTDSTQVEQSPAVRVQARRVLVAHNEKRFELARALPSFSIGFFSQTLIGNQTVDGVERYFGEGDRFHGIQLGVTVPLFFNAASARFTATRYSARAEEKLYDDLSITVKQEVLGVKESIRKNMMSISYYEFTALNHADLLVTQSHRAFREGESDYSSVLLNLRQALDIREEYIRTLYSLNDDMISLLQITEDK